MTLYDQTSDLHHACEAHPVGQRMTQGNVTPQVWADWLWAMRTLHLLADRNIPPGLRRDAALQSDLELLPAANASPAALQHALSLIHVDPLGAAYVLHGAHRRGGRVLAPVMARRGLPTQHVVYRNPEQAEAWVKWARLQVGYAEQARATFACLLAVMDEILERET